MKIGIIARKTTLDQEKCNSFYKEPLTKIHALSENELHFSNFQVRYYDGKLTAKMAKFSLEKLLPKLDKSTLDIFLVADAKYFKFITKVAKISNVYGELCTGKFTGFENKKFMYIPSWKSLFYTPENQELIDQALQNLFPTFVPDIIHSSKYLYTPHITQEYLKKLHKYSTLTCDIETTGLPLNSEIVSISFAWDQHNGIAIYRYPGWLQHLKEFFTDYPGQLLYHNASFDVKHLIWNCFMQEPNDRVGMLNGLKIMCPHHDSKLMVYVAKNSTTRVSLSLKDTARPFAGNYGIGVKDSSKEDPAVLLEYNLKDCLATWYVFNTYLSVAKKENQLRPYTEILQPSLAPVIKMMLTGIPISLERVRAVEKQLTAKHDLWYKKLMDMAVIKDFTLLLQHNAMVKANAKLKVKQHPLSKFQDICFNPNSGNQIRWLLYSYLDYATDRLTDSGEKSTDNKALAELLNQKENEYRDIIEALLELAKISTIVSTFISAFYKYTILGYLHGELVLGGTQSGRLSSKSPNLQNLPSGSFYGKLIKSCFIAPTGWLITGADFNALEERAGTILTQDPNRIKVYVDGFDGHSLRAYKYFQNEMPDILAVMENTPTIQEEVLAINSIAEKYGKIRKKSKTPTFALQYRGTAYTLHKNSGFTMEVATQIETSYHELYKVTDEFNATQIQFAAANGYVELAFGLHLRTPLLYNSIIGSSKTPYAVESEGRSAGNAVTQSYGMLMNRAFIATDKRITASKFSLDIFIFNTIHDSVYFLVRANKPKAIQFLNNVLIEEMEWNDDPKIKSKEVPMCATLELGKSMDKLFDLKNKATLTEIKQFLTKINMESNGTNN